jgi:hypothetical protein
LVNRATTYPPIREPPAMGAVEMFTVPTLSPLSSGLAAPGELPSTDDHRRGLTMPAYLRATGENGPS